MPGGTRTQVHHSWHALFTNCQSMNTRHLTLDRARTRVRLCYSHHMLYKACPFMNVRHLTLDRAGTYVRLCITYGNMRCVYRRSIDWTHQLLAAWLWTLQAGIRSYTAKKLYWSDIQKRSYTMWSLLVIVTKSKSISSLSCRRTQEIIIHVNSVGRIY